jgi:hypothetical protein
MDRDECDAALSVWAVTCDALARGEQVFLLAPGGATEMSKLEHTEFWLLPDWEGQRTQALTEPYQDRLRALDDLRHQDDRARLKFFATVEYLEQVTSPHDLRALDGEHTLRSGAVRGLFGGAGSAGAGESEAGVSLLVLRVHARPEAAVVERRDLEPAGGGSSTSGRLPGALARRWRRLPEPVSVADMDPVVRDERFLSLKAHILQRTGAIRAV